MLLEPACFHDLNKVYHTIPYQTISYHTIPCHAMPCHAMPCHAMPCHAMPCHAMPCHAMPCYAMPCHAIPYHTIPYHECSITGDPDVNNQNYASSASYCIKETAEDLKEVIGGNNLLFHLNALIKSQPYTALV